MQCLNLFPNNRKTVFQFLNIDSGCSIFACRNLLLIFFFQVLNLNMQEVMTVLCVRLFWLFVVLLRVAGSKCLLLNFTACSADCFLYSEAKDTIWNDLLIFQYYIWSLHCLKSTKALALIILFFLAWQSNQTILSLLAIHSSWIMFMLLGLCSCCWYFGITNQKQIINSFMYY